jgi:hypothetical protein
MIIALMIVTFFGMQTAINMMNQRSDLQLVGGGIIILFIGILWVIAVAGIMRQ